MPFLTPLALVGLAFLPLVLAMYLLKLRRNEARVPSTLLWARLVSDVEANAPWQRLRKSLLLLLQLLLVALFALLAARPFVERPAGLARDIVVVIDTSASMQATDVAPSRLEAAKAEAIDALHDLPAGGTVSVIAAGRTASVMVNATTDLDHAKEAIRSIAATPAAGDLGDALRLASALAARSTDAQILVATDAAVATLPTGTLRAPVKMLRVGRAAANQAIVALAVRTASSGLSHSAFVSVANLGLEMATRRIELYADGVLREARTLSLDPQRRTDISIDDIDSLANPASVVEVRLTTPEPAALPSGATVSADDLATDDVAWAVVPAAGLHRILLVGEGDPYLETALTYLPDTELYGVKPADFGPSTHPEKFDLVIFEGWLPAQLPAQPVLAIAPPTTSALGSVTGTTRNPALGSSDLTDPILRYADLSTLHVAEAQTLELPSWARAIIPGGGKGPLLYAGKLDGRPAAVLAFLPRQSDLPLQVAFPILLANLTGELLGGSQTPADAVAPGTPVTLAIPAGATGLRVTLPNASTEDLAAPSPGAASVVFAHTDALGAYSVSPIGGGAGASPSAVASDAGASAAATPAAATPAASANASAAPTFRPADPNAPARFAVDLLDVDESNIAPGDPAKIEALGKTAAAAASPGASGASSSAAATAPAQSRDELWIPITLIALLVIAVEWMVYERDTLVRLRRAAARGLGRETEARR
jgi:hypothetical protein